MTPGTIHDVALCRSCKARIRWVHTAKTGKAIPLDADPVQPGTDKALVVVADRAYGPVDAAEQMAMAMEISLESATEMVHGHPWFITHFATCPAADVHRRSRT